MTIQALDAEIATLIAADAALAPRHQILTSIAGVGTLTVNQLIAAMPELGSLDNKQAASLAGIAPGRPPVRPVERQELHPWRTRKRSSGALHACPLARAIGVD